MIKFLDLHKVNKRFESEFQEKFQNFLDSGHYILGKEVKKFETNFADYCGTKYCIGTSNGLDALTLIFKAYLELGKLKTGDHVLIPANTFFASVLSVINSGLIPVFVEPEKDTFNISIQEIEKSLTSNVKVIMAVHLYGQLANMEAINTFANKHDLLVIEDAAQAHGAKTNSGKKAGNLSHAAAFSFYPSKNLGALGDGGAITTNDALLAETINKLHNYGSEKKYEHSLIGNNHRLDEIQAMFLNIKLSYLDADNLKRQEIAKRYISEMNNDKVKLPFYNKSQNHVFHLFVVCVKDRDSFISYLKKQEIETLIHYPIPPHKQVALHKYKDLSLPITEDIHNTVVSLPISPVMNPNEVTQIINTINAY
mgnify:CR=1 FL=1